MALQLYDLLVKKSRRGSDATLDSLEDPNEFSVDEDDRLNELDPLHSSPYRLEYDEESLAQSRQPRFGDLTRRKRPLGFHAKKDARDAKIRKLRKTFLVPGRLCIIVALILAIIGFVAVGGTGYWVSKQEPIYGMSPSWYPSPKGGTFKSWEESFRKAALLVGQMSLLEKVNVTTGVGWMMGMCVGNTGSAPSVGFPSLCLQDGPLGIRYSDHITATPAGITVGATWNKDLMYKRGRLLGLENRLKGVHVMLGPAIGPLGKMPAGGRNWEGFGSDPVLQGYAAAETIKGIQEEGVIATIKHFIGNEQEHFRQANEWGLPAALSSNIDDRTLHEIYAWPFADSVRAGVGSVMCSYNQVNNSYACQNSKLLNGILKDELGFQGFVQSDWLAQHSGVASALAGLDMSMPGDGAVWAGGDSFWGPHLTRAILNGTLPVERLDDMATRIVAAWYQTGQDNKSRWKIEPPEGADDGPNFSSWTNEEVGLIHPGSDDKTTGVVNHFVDAQAMGGYSHSGLVRRVAAEATVLLKNDGDVLPLSRNGYPQSVLNAHSSGQKYRVAIFGEDATLAKGGPNVCIDRGCNEGTLASGWGSGSVDFDFLASPLEALQHAFHDDKVDVAAFPTNNLPSSASNTGIEEKDLCIVFANADAGEGYITWGSVKGDRNDLNLQKGGDALIRDVAANCGRQSGTGYGITIVVIHSVGPVILESFIDDPNVHAVVYANLPGQESGHALADILFGDYNPSGHLPYTIGKSLEDYGPGGQIMYFPNAVVPQQDYSEGVFVDYRWFDAHNITPRYPFGYGLSYTTFDMKDLVISIPEGMTRPSPLPPPRPEDEVIPPEYDSKIPAVEDVLFPTGWRKLKHYVYPYLESTEILDNGEYPYPDMTPQKASAAGGGEGGNPALWDVLVNVDVTISNTGPRDGQTVVQLYVGFPEDIWEDVWEETENVASQTTPDLDNVEIEDLERRQLEDTRLEDAEFQDIYEDADAIEPAVDDQPQEQSADEVFTTDEMTQENTAPESTTSEIATSDDAAQEDEEPAGDTLEVLPETNQPEQAEEEESAFEDFPTEEADQFDPPQPEPQNEDQTQEDTAPEDLPTDEPTQTETLPPPPPDSQPEDQPSPSDNPPITIAAPPPTPHTGRPTSRERIPMPPRVLRGFEKISTYTKRNGDLFAADTRVVSFKLTRRDLSYWSVRKQNWVLPEGSFTVEVGFDSRDLRVRGSVF